MLIREVIQGAVQLGDAIHHFPYRAAFPLYWCTTVPQEVV